MAIVELPGLITGDIHFHGPFDLYVAGRLIPKARSKNLVLDMPTENEISGAAPAIAIVHTGRWVLECPHCGKDYQFWFLAELMMCTWCWNRDIGGLYRRALRPNGWPAAERILAGRLIERRHWLPPEPKITGALGNERRQTIAELMVE